MIRGFRHTLLMLLVAGVAASALLAAWVQPEATTAITICAGGAVMIGLVCDRIAAYYLRNTLGRLRRVADDISRGRTITTLEAQRGDDFYKLVNAINSVAGRLSELTQEEQRLQEELRRREKLALLGELAATVAHEVNNPLDGLQHCASILRRSLDDPARATQMIDLIDSGLGRIDLIVRRLLTLAREHVIRPQRRRVREIVHAACAAVQTRLQNSGVSVQIEQACQRDWALVDAPLLEQVFVNLLLNAADSMPSGGPLTLRIRAQPADEASAGGGGPPATLCIDVEDRGSGIPPESLPHIFEPFFTTKGGGRGTGLGLAIAARIVDAHHGNLSVEPRETGGTTFTVHLPQADADAADPESQRSGGAKLEAAR